MVDDADKQVDLVMQRDGALQQADEVLDIGRRDVAYDLEGAAVGSVCFDAADGGNRVELVHFSLLGFYLRRCFETACTFRDHAQVDTHTHHWNT